MATNDSLYWTTGYARQPASGVQLTDNTVPRGDSSAQGALQDSTVVVSDAGNVSGVVALAMTGALSGATTIAASTSVATDLLKADTIADEAGTGAPNFSMGATVASTKTLSLVGYLKLTSATAAAVASASIAMPTGGSLVKLFSETVNLDGILTAGLTTGMVVILQSPATGTVTLRDAQSPASAAPFALGAATRALTGNSSWVGYYDGTVLQELSFSVNT